MNSGIRKIATLLDGVTGINEKEELIFAISRRRVTGVIEKSLKRESDLFSQIGTWMVVLLLLLSFGVRVKIHSYYGRSNAYVIVGISWRRIGARQYVKSEVNNG